MKAESNCPNCKERNTYTEITNDLLLFKCSFCGDTWNILRPTEVPNPIRRNPIIVPKTIYVPPLFALLSTNNGILNNAAYISVEKLIEWAMEHCNKDGKIDYLELEKYLE